MSVSVHPSSVVDARAELGAGVEIGPFCVVGPKVQLGDGVKLHSHVVVAGDTQIGARTQIYPFASIGHPPQDLKYKGEPVTLRVGADCLIREGVTMNPGTAGGGGETIVGSHGSFLANSHVAHDCRLGDNVILSNNVMIGGHVRIEDFVIFGGGAAAHQFVRVGAHAFVGAMACVRADLIPYGLAIGTHAWLAGLNYVGMKRRGFTSENIQALRHAYKEIFSGAGTLKERIEDAAATYADQATVQQVVAFLRAGGDAAICLPREDKDEA